MMDGLSTYWFLMFHWWIPSTSLFEIPGILRCQGSDGRAVSRGGAWSHLELLGSCLVVGWWGFLKLWRNWSMSVFCVFSWWLATWVMYFTVLVSGTSNVFCLIFHYGLAFLFFPKWLSQLLACISSVQGRATTTCLTVDKVNSSKLGVEEYGQRLIVLGSCLFIATGWWFGTCVIVPYIGNHHPKLLSYFSEGWLNHQPVDAYCPLSLGCSRKLVEVMNRKLALLCHVELQQQKPSTRRWNRYHLDKMSGEFGNTARQGNYIHSWGNSLQIYDLTQTFFVGRTSHET